MREPMINLKSDSAERVVDKILKYAISQEAEEVLIDFNKKTPAIFYKILDGWEKIIDLSSKNTGEIKSRVQELAGMEVCKNNIPQTGNFKINFNGFKVIFQVSTNPLPHGEKIFLDLYREKLQLFKLRQLGLIKSALKIVEKNLDKNQGMTIVLGNFNSGRTSTLYSLVDFLNKPELNVCTVEEGIDCHLPFVNQIELNASDGLYSHFALLSLIKQDPDVIMVSDISDQKTAQSTFLAADKGHSVLTGIYSKNILTAMSFLQDLGISLHLFLQAVNMFLNQRLVKKICPHCIAKAEISGTKLKSLKEAINFKELLKRTADRALFPTEIKKIEDMTFYKGRGCDRCEGTGLWGSIGVFEILEVTKDVMTIIRSGHLSKIKNEIRNQGGLYIEEDALVKAFHGIISIDEVLRIKEDV